VCDYNHDNGNDHACEDDDDRNERHALREWSLVHYFGFRAEVRDLLWGSRGDVSSVILCFCCRCCCIRLCLGRCVDFRLFSISNTLVISDDESELSNSCSGILAIESNEILIIRECKVSSLIASAFSCYKQFLLWSIIATWCETNVMD